MGKQAPEAETDVLIVGGGPVGLTLAIELARYGLRSAVLTDGLTTSAHPKCNTTNARSMEHFRRLGLSETIRYGGLPPDYPTDIVYLTRLAAPELARVRFPSPREAAAGQAGDPRWLTPEPQHRISQIFLERILLERASADPLVSLGLGQELTGFEVTGETVAATYQDVQTGAVRTRSARWLIGCDGARSTVRRLAGVRYSGESGVRRPIFGGEMLATYFRSTELADLLHGREGFMYWTLNTDIRSVTVAIDGDACFLTHVQAPEGARAEQLQPAQFLPQIVGQPFRFEVLSGAAWNAGYRLVADRFQAGPVFLAGDAAHLFTPTGGFGMNTGIDDVANLAWKLAATAQGWAGPALLASYDAERRPIAWRNTAAASEIADVIANFDIPADIEANGAAGEAARRSVAERVGGVATEEFQTVGVQLGVRYEGSPIVAADGTPPLPDPRTRYEPHGRPGSRLPHFVLGGHSIYDRLIPGLTLLDASGEPEAGAALAAAAHRRGAPFTRVPVDAAHARLLGGPLVLVRPDQHVAWRAAAAPADADALLDRVLGGPSLGRSGVLAPN